MEKYIKGVKVATTTNTKSDINSKRIMIKHPQPKKLTKLELKQILATKVSPKLTSDERSIQTILHKDDVIYERKLKSMPTETVDLSGKTIGNVDRVTYMEAYKLSRAEKLAKLQKDFIHPRMKKAAIVKFKVIITVFNNYSKSYSITIGTFKTLALAQSRIKKAQLHYGMDETKYPHFCKALIYAVSTNMEFIVQQKLVGEVLNTSQREKLENAA